MLRLANAPNDPSLFKPLGQGRSEAIPQDLATSKLDSQRDILVKVADAALPDHESGGSAPARVPPMPPMSSFPA